MHFLFAVAVAVVIVTVVRISYPMLASLVPEVCFYRVVSGFW